MRFFHRILLGLVLCSPLLAQTATLRGLVTDESGAVVPAAKVTVNGPSGLVKSTTTAADGVYSFPGLPPGNYSVTASAPDLSLAQPAIIALSGGAQALNLQLRIASTVQQVTVQDSGGPQVNPEPANNASALVLSGNDLEALPDDPDDLQQDLQALAGPSAGPNGGQIYIDGFSGGELPPKESIREIRINSNPFSPEYDSLGYGRIQIFTKPGTDKFRGSAFFNLGDDVWNSRNPYAEQKAPFLLEEYGGNVSGPVNSRASFFLDIRRDAVDNGSIINGITLDPTTFGITPFTSVFRTPQSRVRVSPRLDYQLNTNNTLTVRYAFSDSNIDDGGIGGFNLVSRAYNTHNTFQTVQATETAVLGTSTVNETRFQYFREGGDTIAGTQAPAVQVLGAFNGGGAQVGRSFDTQNTYELQNYTSVVKGNHAWRFGVRLRGETDDNISPQNFGGTFTFGSIEQYQRTVLGLPGGGATQFSINSGTPSLYGGQFDAGVFAGDDWKMRPNLTVSLGLRYETQTNIHDYKDFAPRIGLAWAPGATAKQASKTVIRVGFGMFYTRFDLSNTMTAERYNGLVEQQYVVTDPTFYPNIPSIASLAGFQSIETIQKVSGTLRAPYMMQSAASVERQLPGHTTLAVTYTNSHGLHMFRSEDINAPLPGTYNPNVRGSGVFPLGTPDPVFQMASDGLYNQNQLIANVNSRLNRNVSLFGFYTLNYARSNTDGLSTFAANPYSSAGEYGPAATDVRNRVFLGGSIESRWGIRFSPFVSVQSGAPFNITTGSDSYGDTLFNARPGIATDPNKPGVIMTQYGLLDPNPTPGEALLPRNFGRGPGAVSFNARLSKTFGFGAPREGGSGGGGGGDHRGGPGGPFGGGGAMGGMFNTPSTPHRYNLTFSMSARNLLNHNNPGPIIGNITSPLFGEANSAAIGWGGGFAENANNRRLELQIRFTF
jgi:hypothetical protein